MKSSAGEYFIGLDHLRAVAIFMVFSWHFIYAGNGWNAPPPVFPLSLLSQGHTGVALFMALSGYLFAKLLDGKKFKYTLFIWNRFLRLAPLLFVVIILAGLQIYLFEENFDLASYAKRILVGIVKPTLPNGGWSITAEFHFYLILPLLLFLVARWKYSLFFVLLGVLIIRYLLHQESGQVYWLSYWTIIGRIDQFMLGILAFQFRRYITGRHFLVLGVFCLFAVFYRYFNLQGGMVNTTSSAIWVYLPTLEGVTYALIIAWYDNSFKHSTGRLSRFISLIGTYSYSIYLLHFFIVWTVSKQVNAHIADLSNLYVALAFSLVCFPLMVPLGYISYRFIESPFLNYRTRYIVKE